MRMFRLLILVFVVAAGLIACASPREPELVTRVQERLEGDSHLHFLRLDALPVEGKPNAVAVTGVVESREQVMRIMELTESTPGVDSASYVLTPFRFGSPETD